MRILFAVSLRFPPQGKSAEGQAEPKTRPIGVVDGQLVNIPALPGRCSRGTQTSKMVEAEVAPRSHRDCSYESKGALSVDAKRLVRYRHLISRCREKPVER